MTHATSYKIIAFSLAAVMALSGCNVKRPERVDGKVVLNGLPSPEVKGMNDTMEDSAKEAAAKGDYKRANEIYRQIVDKDEKNVRYLMSYADTGRKAEMFGAAIDAYDKLLKIEPNNLDAQEGKGLALMSKGDFTAASDVLGKVQEKDAKRWRTLNGLGILFVTRNMLDEAMAYFTEALTQSQNNVSVLNNVGLTLAIKKETQDAIEALALASSLVAADDKRTKEHVDMNLALVYGIAGNVDKAEHIASKYLDGVALDNNLGFYAYLAKDEMLAKSYLNMALSGSSHYYQKAWNNLALVDKGKATQTRAVGGVGMVAAPKGASNTASFVAPVSSEVKAAAEKAIAQKPIEKKEAKKEAPQAEKAAEPKKEEAKPVAVEPAPEPKTVKVEDGQGFLKLPAKEDKAASSDKSLDLNLFQNAFGVGDKK